MMNLRGFKQNYHLSHFPVENAAFPITWQQLWDWTKDKSDGEEVGRSGDVTSCPCAKCFVDLTGSQDPIVEVGFTFLGEKIYNNPNWLDKLVQLVDDSTEDTEDPVYAKEFRNLLLEVADL